MVTIKPRNPEAFHKPASRVNNCGMVDVVVDTPFGITPRDYFAGRALCGLLANSNGSAGEHEAKEAYRLADKMLEARSQQE